MALPGNNGRLGFYPGNDSDWFWRRPVVGELEDGWTSDFASNALFIRCGLDGDWIWHLDDQPGVYERVGLCWTTPCGRDGFLFTYQRTGGVWTALGAAFRELQASDGLEKKIVPV